MNADPITIVDRHVHFVDAELHSYPIFQQRSHAFEVLVGDYSALPRRYLPKDYLAERRADLRSSKPFGQTSCPMILW